MVDIESSQIGSIKSDLMSSIEDLKRCVETARNLSSKFPTVHNATQHSLHSPDQQTLKASVEEAVRQRTLQLTGHSPCSASVSSQRESQSQRERERDSQGDPLTERHKYMYAVRARLWTDCVTAGALRDASLIMSRHLSDSLGVESSSSSLSCGAMILAFKSIPEDVLPSDIVTWFRADVLPHLHWWTEDRTFQTSGPGSLASLLVAELCRRASLSAELLSHPFEALLAADLAVALASSFSNTREVEVIHGPSSDEAVDARSRALLLNLQIQAAIWRGWGDKNRPVISDVEDLGLCGLVRERLWNLRDIEDEIVGDVTYVIEPVLMEFGVVLDDVLQKWVQDAVEQRVVLVDTNALVKQSDVDTDTNNNGSNNSNRNGRDSNSDRQDREDDEEDVTCTLSRLVSVVSLIKDSHRRVNSLLLLFQVPAVDVSEERPVVLLEDESSPSLQEEQSTPCLQSDSAGSNPTISCPISVSTIDRLCALAQAACLLVEPVASEALREALRLHRIKTLAASYGVVSFDPRDRHQIRAVASVIALRAGRTHALRDAMEFASSWGTDSADLSGMEGHHTTPHNTPKNTTLHTTLHYDSLLEILPCRYDSKDILKS